MEMRYAVTKTMGESDGSLRVRVLTPWNHNKVLVELAHQNFCDLDPGHKHKYGILMLPAEAVNRPRPTRRR